LKFLLICWKYAFYSNEKTRGVIKKDNPDRIAPIEVEILFLFLKKKIGKESGNAVN